MAKTSWTAEQQKLIKATQAGWNAARSSGRKTILAELEASLAVLKGSDLTAKEQAVSLLDTFCRGSLMDLLQSVKKYLQNRQTKKEKKPLIRYRKLTWRQVVADRHAKDLEALVRELSGDAKKGSREYVAKYQTGLKQLCDGLSDEKRQEYKKVAEEWDAAGAPEAVQRKSVERHGADIVRQFAEQAYKMMGMRVFVLGAFKDGAGKPSVTA